jgi:hypothetical protein
MLVARPIIFRNRRARTTRVGPTAPPPVTGPVLVAAVLDFTGGDPLVILTFDQAVDVDAMDAAQVSVEDYPGTGLAYVGAFNVMFPLKDAVLVPYSLNFGTKISANPGDYGTTGPIAAEFETKRTAYASAVAAVVAAKDAGIRNSQLVATKDALKLELLQAGRALYAQIQFSPNVTNANKIAAGVHVRKTEPTPIPPPAFAPGMAIESVDGRLVKARVYDAQDLTSKARPAGTIGAMILSHVGPTPPENIRDWTLEGPTGDLTVDVLFPENLQPGTKIWLTSYWFNARKASGPACNPIDAVINYPSSMPTSAAA